MHHGPRRAGRALGNAADVVDLDNCEGMAYGCGMTALTFLSACE
jgi:hypothetical protein